MRRHLDAGYTMVKMKVGGVPLAEDMSRVEAVKSVVGNRGELAVDANCKFDRDEALAYAKALAPFKLRWFEEPCDPLDFALLAEIAERLRRRALDRREPVLDAGRREPGALRRPEGRARRRHPGRSAAGLRHRAIRPHARHAGAPRLAARRPVPARRQPDVAAHRRRLRPRRRGILSRRVRRFRAASPTTRGSRTAISSCRTGPASASRGRRRSTASCANWPRSAARAEACYASPRWRGHKPTDLEGTARRRSSRCCCRAPMTRCRRG